MNWLNVVEGTLFLALFPFVLAAYGGHLAAESIPEEKKQGRAKWIFWVLCFAGVIVGFHQQYLTAQTEEKAEKARAKSEAVQAQIATDLKELHSQGQQNPNWSAPVNSLPTTYGHQPSNRPKSHPTMLADPISTEMQRRQRIVSSLRSEYILSHDNISPGLMAGSEYPPTDWVNKRLAEMGEKWRFNETKDELITHAMNLASDLKKNCAFRVFNPVGGSVSDIARQFQEAETANCDFKTVGAGILSRNILGMLPKSCADERTASFEPASLVTETGSIRLTVPDYNKMAMELTRLANALRAGGC